MHHVVAMSLRMSKVYKVPLYLCKSHIFLSEIEIEELTTREKMQWFSHSTTGIFTDFLRFSNNAKAIWLYDWYRCDVPNSIWNIGIFVVAPSYIYIVLIVLHSFIFTWNNVPCRKSLNGIIFISKHANPKYTL